MYAYPHTWWSNTAYSFLSAGKTKIPIAKFWIIIFFLKALSRTYSSRWSAQCGALYSLHVKEFIRRWQGKVVFLIALLAKGQAWQQEILFLSFAHNMLFGLSILNIYINAKCEYCRTKRNKFLHHSVCSDTGGTIHWLFYLVWLPLVFTKTLN